MVHDVFISYSTKDKVTADAICHVLEENNIRCWIAPRNITSGKPYAEEIIDAIISTKIVVLVFSSYAQNSQFVNNEINLAFSNNKPIISFKIDESMPERELEYYLKVSHWLEAYPTPEAVFKILIRDASRLLGREEQNPIVDSNVMQKAKSGEFNQLSLKNDWKTLILMFTPLYPVVLMYMGISAKMKKITVQGAICFLPVFVLIIGRLFSLDMVFTKGMIIAQNFTIALWIISLIYIFIIRKDYLFKKTIMNLVGDDDELFVELMNEYGDI